MKKTEKLPEPKIQGKKWSGFGFKPITLRIDWRKREEDKREAEAFREQCGDGRSRVSVYKGDCGLIIIAPRYGSDGSRESLTV